MNLLPNRLPVSSGVGFSRDGLLAFPPAMSKMATRRDAPLVRSEAAVVTEIEFVVERRAVHILVPIAELGASESDPMTGGRRRVAYVDDADLVALAEVEIVAVLRHRVGAASECRGAAQLQVGLRQQTAIQREGQVDGAVARMRQRGRVDRQRRRKRLPDDDVAAAGGAGNRRLRAS